MESFAIILESLSNAKKKKKCFTILNSNLLAPVIGPVPCGKVIWKCRPPMYDTWRATRALIVLFLLFFFPWILPVEIACLHNHVQTLVLEATTVITLYQMERCNTSILHYISAMILRAQKEHNTAQPFFWPLAQHFGLGNTAGCQAHFGLGLELEGCWSLSSRLPGLRLHVSVTVQVMVSDGQSRPWSLLIVTWQACHAKWGCQWLWLVTWVT